MKSKYVILLSAILISVSTFAQKDELKTLKKIYSKESPSSSDMVDFKSNLSKLEGIASEEGDKVYVNFYKSMLPFMELNMLGTTATPAQMNDLVNSKSISDLTTGLNATLDFEKKSGKQIFTNDIAETIKSFQPMFLNYAIDLGNQKKYKESASVLHSLYQLNKKDQEKLYYAANYAINAEDYDTAFGYYEELKKQNYSGEGTSYYAKNVVSDKEDFFGTSLQAKMDRDGKVKLKLYVNPRDEKIPSKRGEILKNIALILVQKGKVQEAKTALSDARIANPDDISLILTEADIYLKLEDFTTYKKLITEVLEKNPTNADLVFNLGVISYNNKELVEAEKYYKRAIEIDPKYSNAYLNLAILKLDAEKSLINQMNKLGTSPAENKKYEILKKQREDVFKSVIPYLEKVVEFDDKNENVLKTLLNVYNALEMTDKAKALKLKMK